MSKRFFSPHAITNPFDEESIHIRYLNVNPYIYNAEGVAQRAGVQKDRGQLSFFTGFQVISRLDGTTGKGTETRIVV